MRELVTLTCDYCGLKFESTIKTAKYCSQNCANLKYMERKRRKKKEKGIPLCRHNQWVVCEHQCSCGNCGWNPKVAQRRMDKLVGKECNA